MAMVSLWLPLSREKNCRLTCRGHGYRGEDEPNRKDGGHTCSSCVGGLYVCSAVGDICDSSSQPGSFPISVAIDSPSDQSYPDQEPKSQNLE